MNRLIILMAFIRHKYHDDGDHEGYGDEQIDHEGYSDH